MISRVTLPGRLRATSVGSLRKTRPIDSPLSVWTMSVSRSASVRLRELRKEVGRGAALGEGWGRGCGRSLYRGRSRGRRLGTGAVGESGSGDAGAAGGRPRGRTTVRAG